MRELAAIHLPRSHLLGIHRTRFEAHEGVSLPLVADIHDHDMRVQMRVEFARCVLGEAGKDEPACGLFGDFAVDPVPHQGMLFEVGERHADGLLMRGEDPLITCNEGHDRDRLRGVYGEVPTRMMLDLPLGTSAAQLLVTDLSLQQRLEDGRVDLAFQSELVGNLAAPFGMLVGALRVVVADRVIAGDVGG